MYYLLYKTDDIKREYPILLLDDEEFDSIMKISYVTPLLMTESLELARETQRRLSKKEP